MVLVRELSNATANFLELPSPTVAMYTRRLREAGLISEKGRGRGAARATPLDAANLLIALAVNLGPERAAESVVDFGRLRIATVDEVQPGEPDATQWGGVRLQDAYELPSDPTLAESVAAIISGFADKRFAEKWCAAERSMRRVESTVDRFDAADCSVAILVTSLSAVIHLTGNRYYYADESMRRILRSESMEDKVWAARTRAVGEGLKYRRGISTVRKIPFSVLRKIAAVVNGGEIDLNALIKTTNHERKRGSRDANL